jgi:hypothetical protein
MGRFAVLEIPYIMVVIPLVQEFNFKSVYCK